MTVDPTLTEAEEWRSIAAEMEEMGHPDMAAQCRLQAAQSAREAEARDFMETVRAASLNKENSRG